MQYPLNMIKNFVFQSSCLRISNFSKYNVCVKPSAILLTCTHLEHRLNISFKRSVKPETVKNIASCYSNFYDYDAYKSVHFWNGNESESPFLISNFTKNSDFFEETAKITFLVKKICDKLKKNNFELKMLKLLENHVKTLLKEHVFLFLLLFLFLVLFCFVFKSLIKQYC